MLKVVKKFLIIFFILSSTLSAENFSGKVAIVVSKKIKPYMKILAGIEKGLINKVDSYNVSIDTDVYFTTNSKKDLIELEQTIIDKNYALTASIGPEATKFIFESDKIKALKIFSGVLDFPLTNNDNACGISFRIPAKTQLENISYTFPKIKKIGIIFDPKNNIKFYQEALEVSKEYGVEILALMVNSRNEITDVIDKNMPNLDLLWMIPDKTVISEKIIYYIIKSGIYNNTGVVGYNSFFTNSGAVFAFKFNYETLGVQTSTLILENLRYGLCLSKTPVFNCRVNDDIADKIGIKFRSPKCQ